MGEETQSLVSGVVPAAWEPRENRDAIVDVGVGVGGAGARGCMRARALARAYVRVCTGACVRALRAGRGRRVLRGTRVAGGAGVGE